MASQSAARTGGLFLPLPGEGNSEYRVRIAREQAERTARHQQDLDEQTSLHNTPYQRISWWERVHVMRLPKDPAHPLLDVVAKQTGLSLEQIRTEQQRRQVALSAIAALKS
jgi:hypothetical protein